MEQAQKSPFDLDYTQIKEEFKSTAKKFLMILGIVVLRRTIDLVWELLSGKVMIPVLFFYLASKIQIQGLDSTLNSVIQIGVGGVGSAGALWYKLKKDTARSENG